MRLSYVSSLAPVADNQPDLGVGGAVALVWHLSRNFQPCDSVPCPETLRLELQQTR
jgi:hypothetical protein